MTDISISGMKLTYPDNMVMNEGDKVELNFKLLTESPDSAPAPHKHEPKMRDFSIKGFVKWIAGGREKSCGIEFEVVNLADRIKLADFINYTKVNHETWIRQKLNEISNNPVKR
jgi:hypothetical protein